MQTCRVTHVSRVTVNALDVDYTGLPGLTEGLHGLHQLEGEGLVPGQLLEHASHLVVPRAHDVAAVDALDVVAHADHLHVVHHAVVLDALPGRPQERGQAS